MNVSFSFVEMFVNKVHIYNMSLVRCLLNLTYYNSLPETNRKSTRTVRHAN